MSYTPYTWQSGDTVTAARLNNIEQGVAGAGGILVANQLYDEVQDVAYLDKTFNDIIGAIDSGKNVMVLMVDGEYDRYVSFVSSIGYEEGLYHVLDRDNDYVSDSADGTLVIS